MEDYQGFENWLKSNKYVSWKTYMSFMKQIETTLLIKNFDKIRSVVILEQLFKQLEVNRAFAQEVNQIRIISYPDLELILNNLYAVTATCCFLFQLIFCSNAPNAMHMASNTINHPRKGIKLISLSTIKIPNAANTSFQKPHW